MSAQDPIFATRTTTKLLDALRDHGNEPVWTHLDARYRPVIKGLARRLGLGESDAEEVAQQALSDFVRSFRAGNYDRTKGRLSSWILGIAHNTVRTLLKRKTRTKAAGIDAVPELADLSEPDLRHAWNEERDRVIFMHALGMLRDESGIDDRTLLAFELVALRQVHASEAAARCSMSVDQVYVARSRVTKRLKAIVTQLTSAFEDDA